MAIFNSYFDITRGYIHGIHDHGIFRRMVPLVHPWEYPRVDLDTRPGNLLHTANELDIVVISTMNGI